MGRPVAAINALAPFAGHPSDKKINQPQVRGITYNIQYSTYLTRIPRSQVQAVVALFFSFILAFLLYALNGNGLRRMSFALVID